MDGSEGRISGQAEGGRKSRRSGIVLQGGRYWTAPVRPPFSVLSCCLSILLLSPKLHNLFWPAGRGSSARNSRRANPDDPTAETYNLICRAQFEIGNLGRRHPRLRKSCRDGARKRHLPPLAGSGLRGESGSRGISEGGRFGRESSHRIRARRRTQPKSWEARSDLAEFYLEAPALSAGVKIKLELRRSF